MDFVYTLRNKVAGATILTMTPESGRGDERRSIERELRRGSLELIVLHLLAPGEAYGYEIVSKLTEQTNGALEVTDGTRIPCLPPRAGGICRHPLGNARPRRAAEVYRLTDAGREELVRLKEEWTSFAKAMARLLRQ